MLELLDFIILLYLYLYSEFHIGNIVAEYTTTKRIQKEEILSPLPYLFDSVANFLEGVKKDKYGIIFLLGIALYQYFLGFLGQFIGTFLVLFLISISCDFHHRKSVKELAKARIIFTVLSIVLFIIGIIPLRSFSVYLCLIVVLNILSVRTRIGWIEWSLEKELFNYVEKQLNKNQFIKYKTDFLRIQALINTTLIALLIYLLYLIYRDYTTPSIIVKVGISLGFTWYMYKWYLMSKAIPIVPIHENENVNLTRTRSYFNVLFAIFFTLLLPVVILVALISIFNSTNYISLIYITTFNLAMFYFFYFLWATILLERYGGLIEKYNFSMFGRLLIARGYGLTMGPLLSFFSLLQIKEITFNLNVDTFLEIVFILLFSIILSFGIAMLGTYKKYIQQRLGRYNKKMDKSRKKIKKAR